MTFPDLLGIYAELSIGLAGFGGVAAAFSGRERRFNPTELIRLQALLLSAGSVFVGCLGFFVSSAFDATEAGATLGAAGASLPITLYYAATVVPPAWRGVFDPESTSRMGVVSVFSVLTAAMVLAYCAVLLAGGSQAYLLSGFSIQLAFGLWMFVRLLTRAN